MNSYPVSFRITLSVLIIAMVLLSTSCNTVPVNEPVAVTPDVDIGMSDRLYIRCTCDKPIDVIVYDKAGNVFARAKGDDYSSGFIRDGFIYHSFADNPELTEATIYMPNQGYRIVFSYGEDEGVSVDFACEVSTLVAEGWKDICVNHTTNTTLADGIIAVLDGTSQGIFSDNIASKISGEVVIHYTDWKLPESIKMNLNDIQTITVTGSRAAEAIPLINWHSSDSDIVEVSADGTITAHNYGRASVSATDGNKPSVCQVTVMQNATAVTLEDITMVIGERTLIRPQFEPLTATETDMTYTVNEEGIIRINKMNVMLALRKGTVTVSGTTSYGVRDVFTVTVVDDTESTWVLPPD